MIEFLTLFLGIVAGPQKVVVAADTQVAGVELRLDGETIAALEMAPWEFEVDFGTELLPRKLEAVALDRVESNGYAFQIELKLRAWRKGFTPVEIPIVFTERETGDSKMSKRIVLEAVWKVWKLRLMDLFGRL